MSDNAKKKDKSNKKLSAWLLDCLSAATVKAYQRFSFIR